MCGVVTGIVSAIVSAPVVVYLFGGVTGSGSAFVVAFFLKTGQQLLKSALFAGLTTEPIDKTLQVLLAALLYRATPQRIHRHAGAGKNLGGMTPNGAVVFALLIIVSALLARDLAGLLVILGATACLRAREPTAGVERAWAGPLASSCHSRCS